MGRRLISALSQQILNLKSVFGFGDSSTEKEEKAVTAVKKEPIAAEQFIQRFKQKKSDKYLKIEVRVSHIYFHRICDKTLILKFFRIKIIIIFFFFLKNSNVYNSKYKIICIINFETSVLFSLNLCNLLTMLWNTMSLPSFCLFTGSLDWNIVSINSAIWSISHQIIYSISLTIVTSHSLHIKILWMSYEYDWVKHSLNWC